MHYDYIIVGGGSSGCVTATTLVRQYGARVLLLEAGSPNNHPLLKMPSGFIKMLAGSQYLNFHKTIPQKQLDNRIHEVPQAKVLGGGSTVNAQVYMRGRPSDFEHWEKATHHKNNSIHWRWDDILPYYIKQENNQSLANDMHGIDGPLHVSNAGHSCAMSDIFVKTLQQMGCPFTMDFNGGHQHGVGYMQSTIKDGKRCGAVEAFLSTVMDNPLLTVRTNVAVQKLVIEKGQATGVVINHNGKTEIIHANNEIIMTAGAFGTPKILMLSGIGNADHLSEHGIDVAADLKGVGENLMDHHEVPIVASTNGHYGYFGEDKGWNMIRNGLQYMMFGTGPVASNGCETCAFINPVSPNKEPSLQFYCVPTVYLDGDVTNVKPVEGVTLNSCLLQPKARGSVRLKSNNYNDSVAINSNYLGHPDDIKHSIAGLRYARDVIASHPMQQCIVKEIFPGSTVSSDADLLAHCKRTVKTNYHPCGTCRMGKDSDPMAVLTPDLKVKGIDGLRVFDVSMIPQIISGNTNAIAMAVAERGCDIMMQSMQG